MNEMYKMKGKSAVHSSYPFLNEVGHMVALINNSYTTILAQWNQTTLLHVPPHMWNLGPPPTSEKNQSNK
jgi:hypothetical protein